MTSQYAAYHPATLEAILWNDYVHNAAQTLFEKIGTNVMKMIPENIINIAEKLENGETDWKEYVKYEPMDPYFEDCEVGIVHEILNNKMVRINAQALHETGEYEIMDMDLENFNDALLQEGIDE